MIYYDFSKFQPIYCKRTLGSTIHLSHGLRKKDPALLSIVTWGPSHELEAEEALKALDSGERSHAGGQEAGKKHESITCDRFRARVGAGDGRRRAGDGAVVWAAAASSAPASSGERDRPGQGEEL